MKTKVSLGILILLVIYLFGKIGYEKITTTKPILTSEAVEENIIYVQECLLGKLFKQNANEILYTYIKDNEVFFDLINVKTKKTVNKNKIGEKELSDVKISAPYMISNPEFIETKDKKILVSLNGVNRKQIITKIFLYDPVQNTYSEIKTDLYDIKTPLILQDGKILVYSKTRAGEFKIEIHDNNKLVSKLTKKDRKYTSLYPLKNGKILILDTWQNPIAIYNPEKNTIKPMQKTAYANSTNFEELSDGNLAFVTNEEGRHAIELYDIDKEEFHVVLSDAKSLTIVPLIGNKIYGTHLFTKINGDYYSVYPETREYKKLYDIDSETLSFPVAIARDKILLNKMDGVKLLDLNKNEVFKKNPVDKWPGSFIYKLTDNKSLIVNDASNQTYVYDNNKNSIKKGMKLSSDFYHSFPHQVVPLDDGRYVIHYMETYGELEKKYGIFGKLLSAALITVCTEDLGGICDDYNNQPFFSYIITEIGK